jgi:lipoyl(octanoyl) transferase
MTESAPTPSNRPPLDTYLLGLVELDEALLLQRRLAYDLGERVGAALMLCEHPPVITVGRNGSRAHIGPDDEALRTAGLRTRWVNRGGGTILHVPGQLAGYLVTPIEALGLSLAEYLKRLESALIGLLADFDLAGETRPDAAGIFLGYARVATLGIAVSRGIAYHGFTLNVGPWLGAFDLIGEPGPGGQLLRQTSLEARRQRQAPMHRVRESLISHVERALELERAHVFTDHPLIRRKRNQHVHVSSPG